MTPQRVPAFRAPVDGERRHAARHRPSKDPWPATHANGGTALYNAVYATIRQLQKLHTIDGEVRRQAIAVLTDGEDTASIVSADDLLMLARNAGVAVYTIMLKSSYPSISSGCPCQPTTCS